MLPQFFILVALTLTSLTLSAALFLAWHSFGRQRHALMWALAFLVGAVQWAVNLFGDVLFRDRQVYWIVVNAIPLVILSLALIGHRLRVGRESLWRELLALALIVELGVVIFTVFKPHVGLRMAIQPAYAGVILIWSALTVLRGSARPGAAEWGAAIVNGAFGMVELAAATCALLQGASGDETYLGWYLRVNFLLMPSGYVATGVFAVFLVANDLSEAMRRLARTDQLTQVLNRRGFDEAMRAFTGQRAGDVALVLSDIDHFKAINDRYGHEAGDRAIRAFADQLRAAANEHAYVARLGGEEFVVAVPGMTQADALALAERIRAQLHGATVDHEGQAIALSASFGVTALRAQDRSVYDALGRADRALYRAKQEGRDRVVLADAA